MAVVYERYEDSADLVRAYSDMGMMIKQDGTNILYAEAIDPDYMNRTYTETDIPIENEEPEIPGEEESEFLPSQEAIDLIFGGTR